MKKILELAKKVADQVEVTKYDSSNRGISFQNERLHSLDSGYKSGYTLRIIKDGKVGFSYTTNLRSRQELVDNAVATLKGNVEADFEFPKPADIKNLDLYNPEIEKISNIQLHDEAKKQMEYYKNNIEGDYRVGTGIQTGYFRIINSNGVDYETKHSVFTNMNGLIYPGSGTSLIRFNGKRNFQATSNSELKEFGDYYTKTLKDVKPKSGKMKVLFRPFGMGGLFNMRFNYAFSGENAYKKTSKLVGKIGEKIVSEKLTIMNNPFNDNYLGAQAFDDEGTPSKKYNFIENGVFKNFYTDLKYAKKLGVEPTGNGYASFGILPSPTPKNMEIAPGDKSFEEMIKEIDRGIIVEGAMGAHSGNIPNGDFSVGLNPGIYVENGKIVGRVKDAMIAGNIFEMLKNIISIENKQHFNGAGMVPSILVDNVSFSC